MNQKTFYQRAMIVFVFITFIVFQGLSQINFPNFKTVNGLQFLGSAGQNDSVLQLTDDVNNQVGAAWYLIKQNMKNGFESSFQFQITPASASRGDGFAFVIQNDTVKKIDSLDKTSGGVLLGYGRYKNGLAIEFDTYQNYTEYAGGNVIEAYDPDANHIGVMISNTMLDEFITPNHNACLATAPSENLPCEMADDNPHKVKAIYNGKTMSVSLDDQPVISVEVDLQMILGAKDEAWVGFTASTGNAKEMHAIYNWTFKQGNTHIRFQSFGKDELQSDRIWINPNSQNQVFYSLTRAQQVNLNLYDSQGKKVMALDQCYRNQGIHCIEFSSHHLANGRYFIQLRGERENVNMPYLLIRN